VFRTLRYDNMGSLVKKILRGRQRIETDRIIAFRSHWGYQSQYCNPAKRNEKGGVEGELGWYRRNCLTPVWGQLEQRLGKSAGTREMITLVRAGSASGCPK
jgi:hypothetical protein